MPFFAILRCPKHRRDHDRRPGRHRLDGLYAEDSRAPRREGRDLHQQLRQSSALRAKPCLVLHRSAHNTGIKANNPVDGGGWGGFKDKEKNALPVWLKKAGYRTALIGKYLNRYGQERTFGSLLSCAGSYLHISFTRPNIRNN